ncbi:MinD/ParA family protein [bacterium]|nr:MinD/ParA family protein [bacterium]
MMGDQAERLRELVQRGKAPEVQATPPILARLESAQEPDTVALSGEASAEAKITSSEEIPAAAPEAAPEPRPEVSIPLPEPGARAGRTIVITSGKGGVGKTNVTVNLALTFARRGRKTILFDADLGMANVDVMMGVSPPHSIADVIKGRKTLLEVVHWVSDHLGIVPGGSGVSELANLEPSKLETVIAQLAALESQAEIILVDTGAGISRNVVNFVMAASEILVVTTPEPTAITDAYGMIKEIDANNPSATVQLLVNMADSEAEARSVAAKLAMIVERFLSVKIQYIGCIERDGHVSRSVLMQQPFTHAYPNATATRRLNILAGTLLAQNDEAKPSGGFFSRLVHQIFRSGRS